jgi:hypothetical protein
MLLAHQMAWLSTLADDFGTARRYALAAEPTTAVDGDVVDLDTTFGRQVL